MKPLCSVLRCTRQYLWFCTIFRKLEFGKKYDFAFSVLSLLATPATDRTYAVQGQTYPSLINRKHEQKISFNYLKKMFFSVFKKFVSTKTNFPLVLLTKIKVWIYAKLLLYFKNNNKHWRKHLHLIEVQIQ